MNLCLIVKQIMQNFALFIYIHRMSKLIYSLEKSLRSFPVFNQILKYQRRDRERDRVNHTTR